MQVLLFLSSFVPATEGTEQNTTCAACVNCSTSCRARPSKTCHTLNDVPHPQRHAMPSKMCHALKDMPCSQRCAMLSKMCHTLNDVLCPGSPHSLEPSLNQSAKGCKKLHPTPEWLVRVPYFLFYYGFISEVKHTRKREGLWSVKCSQNLQVKTPNVLSNENALSHPFALHLSCTLSIITSVFALLLPWQNTTKVTEQCKLKTDKPTQHFSLTFHIQDVNLLFLMSHPIWKCCSVSALAWCGN